MHNCPFDGCTAQVELTRFMCLRHWRLVPLGQGRKITAAFKRYQKATTRAQAEGEYKLLRQYQNEALEALGCKNRMQV